MATKRPLSQEEDGSLITEEFKLAASKVFMPLSFYLVNLDNLDSSDWYSEPGMVPLIPRNLNGLATAYSTALQTIVESDICKCSKVEEVYVHFGIGGLFLFNPRSKALDDLTPVKLKLLLRRLFQHRELHDPQTNELIAREIRTGHDVDVLYANFRDNYLKIGCNCGPKATCPNNLVDFLKKTSNKPATKHVLFLVGRHLEVMDEKGLVDQFVKVCDCVDPKHTVCTDRIRRYMKRSLKALVNRRSKPRNLGAYPHH